MRDLADSPTRIGCPLACWEQSGWPDCGHGFPQDAPPEYDLLGPPNAIIQHVGLRQIADSMMKAVEAIETGNVGNKPLKRGPALAALVSYIRETERIIVMVKAYALKAQYGTLDSELPRGYVPLPDPVIKRKGGIER